MTDQSSGEGITAWLETAITRREEAARAAHETAPAPWTADILEGTGLIVAADDQPLWDCEGASALCMTAAAATHAALNDPEVVLRRCAADRRLLELHQAVHDHGRYSGPECPVECAGQHEGQPAVCAACRDYAGDAVEAPCPTVLLAAEGYGWAPSETGTAT